MRRTDQPDPPDREHFVAGLSQVLVAGQRMSALVDQMLDLTRLQMGRSLDLHRVPTDLVALVRAVVESYASTTKRHVIRVVADPPELIGNWDASRMERVIQNLLSNAIKYSPNGGEISVTVAQERDATGGIAVLTVRDQGLGIPAEDLPRLFDRFYRGGNVVGQSPRHRSRTRVGPPGGGGPRRYRRRREPPRPGQCLPPSPSAGELERKTARGRDRGRSTGAVRNPARPAPGTCPGRQRRRGLYADHFSSNSVCCRAHKRCDPRHGVPAPAGAYADRRDRDGDRHAGTVRLRGGARPDTEFSGRPT